MRACRYCSHQNADHLGYCCQCGRRMSGVVLAPAAPTGVTAAMSRTMLAPQVLGRNLPTIPIAAATAEDNAAGAGPHAAQDARAAARGLGWVAGSIAYIYVYLRGKLDAGERRRRLVEERDGAERLLGGAIKELGLTILAHGIQHPDLTGLLEAIGRAEARREGAVADIAASEKLQAAEEARLGAGEAAMEAEWSAADKASREAEELTRGVSAESQEAAARLARVKDERARRERDAEAADANPQGRQRAAHLRHEAAGLKSEQAALESQVWRLDQQLVAMRQRSATLRAAAQASRTQLDAAIATRRSAGSAMKASIAGHMRERADAEREVADLTDQLGRAAGQARSTVPLLMPGYQRIDRLQETLTDRQSQIAALDQSLQHYDQRKLLTGVGLVTSMIAVMVAVLWVVLK
jgi:hypothetical protein